MLREMLLGKNTSDFHINPLVKAYILSETFLWSAKNFILPIFALFVIQLPGGTVENAATAYSLYIVMRVIFELISGRRYTKANDTKKLFVTVFGMFILTLGYIGLAFTTNLIGFYFFFALLGLGIGFVSPVKNSVFAMHLDKDREAMEWSIQDAIVFFCIALCAALGGFIAKDYGFQLLFLVAAFVNTLGVLPYLAYLKTHDFQKE